MTLNGLKIDMTADDADMIAQALEARILPKLQAMLAGQPGEPKDAYLTKSEVAQRLKVSVKTVENRVKSGELPEPVKLGALRRWRVADLIERGA